MMERKLAEGIRERREQGRAATARWIVFKAKELCGRFYPRSEFKASNGWLWLFLRRHGLSFQRRTNSRVAVRERQLRWQLFHCQFRRMLQSTPTRHARDGRFPIATRCSLDQVPCAFTLAQEYTYNNIGDTRVWLPTPSPGLEKRQCTLQLCFRADGLQPKGAIIFCGTGKRIRSVEKELWDDRVDVYFQPKAWVDRDIAVAWA